MALITSDCDALITSVLVSREVTKEMVSPETWAQFLRFSQVRFAAGHRRHSDAGQRRFADARHRFAANQPHVTGNRHFSHRR